MDSEGKTVKNDMGHQISTKVDEKEQSLNVEKSQYMESKSIEWTDEKHSLYLKSMEASFVDQLYGARNESLSRPKSSRQKQASPSSQYKVFRDNSWTKIAFKRDEPHQNKSNESGVHLASPWIKHYKSPRRHQTQVNSELQRNTTLGVKRNQSRAYGSDLCHQYHVCSTTEVMDQNFVDEDLEEGKSSRKHSTKRTKISYAGSSNDQVVPFGLSSVAYDTKE